MNPRIDRAEIDDQNDTPLIGGDYPDIIVEMVQAYNREVKS